ncbi:MAG: pyridoxamine 5'-phosphate oxidase family protein [Candidatus Bathyarchaeia archaeon]
MPFKLPWMTEEEIEELIDEQMICRIAFNGPDHPYLAPFQYVILEGEMYFHFTNYGRKMRLIKRDNRACVQIERYEPDLSSYSFISMRGRLVIVDDDEERKRVTEKFSEEGRESLSPSFLAAHGIDPLEGWESLSHEKDLVIVKLEDIVDKVGLKSP